MHRDPGEFLSFIWPIHKIHLEYNIFLEFPKTEKRANDGCTSSIIIRTGNQTTSIRHDTPISIFVQGSILEMVDDEYPPSLYSSHHRLRCKSLAKITELQHNLLLNWFWFGCFPCQLFLHRFSFLHIWSLDYRPSPERQLASCTV